MSAAKAEPAALFAFDLLWRKGEDLRSLSLLKRKAALKESLSNGRINYATHIQERGLEFFKQVSDFELEGIVANQADSPYVAGRSRYWLKIKMPAGREWTANDFAI